VPGGRLQPGSEAARRLLLFLHAGDARGARSGEDPVESSNAPGV
jgi:hypothetical protein